MASVEFRRGDTLNFLWTSVQKTPFGTKEVQSTFQFTYDELMDKLGARPGKSRKSGTEGAKFSRVVALAANAIKKGKWSTGADIDRKIVFDKLIENFEELDANEHKNITSNAFESLESIYKHKSLLTSGQKKILKSTLTLIETAKGK